MTPFTIRKATIDDTALILGFVRDLARYERAEHEVTASPSDIEQSLFSESSTAHALICHDGDTPIGFAVYFFNYSTWLGKNGLYLEDLYISPENRGAGAGKALLKHLAQVAIENSCGRFEWCVLDWNEPAIKFYTSIGARPLNEWIGYRLDGNPLKEFAGS